MRFPVDPDMQRKLREACLRMADFQFLEFDWRRDGIEEGSGYEEPDFGCICVWDVFRGEPKQRRVAPNGKLLGMDGLPRQPLDVDVEYHITRHKGVTDSAKLFNERRAKKEAEKAARDAEAKEWTASIAEDWVRVSRLGWQEYADLGKRDPEPEGEEIAPGVRVIDKRRVS